MRLALLALFWRFETPPQLSPLPVMRNINRPANSFTVTGDAEYKHAGNKVSPALCPLSRGAFFFRRWVLGCGLSNTNRTLCVLNGFCWKNADCAGRLYKKNGSEGPFFFCGLFFPGNRKRPRWGPFLSAFRRSLCCAGCGANVLWYRS